MKAVWIGSVILFIFINCCACGYFHDKPPSPSPSATPFLMPIEDVFTIQGRGVVVTGRVERGTLKNNEAVEIVGIRPTKQTIVVGIEKLKKLLDEAATGENVGLLLRGVERQEVQRGQIIATPGSIRAYTKFKAKVDTLTREEGGRNTPFFTGYKPQFYFRTIDVSGVLKLANGVEMVIPGDRNVEVDVELALPIALEEGMKFAIRENGRTIAAGTVISISG